MPPLIDEGKVPLEDRIDRLARLVLVVLLLVTLGWVGHGRARNAALQAAEESEPPLTDEALRAPRKHELVQLAAISHNKGAGAKSR